MVNCHACRRRGPGRRQPPNGQVSNLSTTGDGDTRSKATAPGPDQTAGLGRRTCGASSVAPNAANVPARAIGQRRPRDLARRGPTLELQCCSQQPSNLLRTPVRAPPPQFYQLTRLYPTLVYCRSAAVGSQASSSLALLEVCVAAVAVNHELMEEVGLALEHGFREAASEHGLTVAQ